MDWFWPRLYTTSGNGSSDTASSPSGLLASVTNSTLCALASAISEGARSQAKQMSIETPRKTQAGLGFGLEWLHRIFGRREWIIRCLNVKIVL